MKFFKTRNLIITGAIAVGLGGILFLSGYSMGGMNNYISFKNFAFTAQPTSIQTQSKTLDSSIRNLTLNADAVKIIIQVGNEFSVKGSFSADQDLHVSNSGDTATLTLNHQNGGLIDFSFWHRNAETVTITVPSTDQIKNLNLEIKAGSANLQNLQLSNLTGHFDAGSLNVENTATKTLNLTGDAASLTFTRLKLENSSTAKLNASSLKFNQSQLPALDVTGDAGSLAHNGQEQRLPYKENGSNLLKISMDASSTTITD